MNPIKNKNILKKLLALRLPIAVITDCAGNDADAESRLSMLFQSLFGMTPILCHAGSIDSMAFLAADSLTRCYRKGLVVGNIAPRHKAQGHENGIPFAWTKLKGGHIAVCTGQKDAFAGFKTCGILTSNIHVVNTRQALLAMVKAGFIDESVVDHIANSQFRSLDFEPLLAAAVLLGIKIPTEEIIRPEDVPNLKEEASYVDRFGNVKTGMTEEEVAGLQDGEMVTLKIHTKKIKIPFYRQLRSVPDKKLAFIVGSSGFHSRHFCELVINGGEAAKKLKLKVGDKIEILN